MSCNSYKRTHSQARFQPARFRIIQIFILLALALGRTSPAQAAPKQSLTVTFMFLSPDTDLILCEGERAKFTVRLVQSTFDWFNLPDDLITYAPVLGGTIQTSSSSNLVGSISPSSSSIRVQPGNIYSVNSFTFTAARIGTTTLRFHDTGGGPDRATARDVTLTVEVKKCNYQLVVFSNWTLQEPFLIPHLNSIFEAELVPDQAGHIGPVRAPVENFSRHTQSMPYCGHPVNATNNEATITGQLDVNKGTLDLKITYDLVTAKTEFICPYDVGATNLSQGQVLVFDPQPLEFKSGAGASGKALPHILRAVSDTRGYSSIVILPIYLP